MTAEPVWILMIKARSQTFGPDKREQPLLVFDDEAAAKQTLAFLKEMPLAGRAAFRIAKALRPIFGQAPSSDDVVRSITFADVLASAIAETEP